MGTRYLCLLSIGLVICSAGGCATTATITRIDGRSTDAELVGADRENVYVKTAGGNQAIRRSEITDIDHPGDTAIVIGTLLAAYGVANIAVGYKYCDSKGTAYCVGVFAPATIGLPMAIWGLSVHGSSVDALQQTSGSDGLSSLRIVPAVTFSEGQRATSAVIQANF